MDQGFGAFPTSFLIAFGIAAAFIAVVAVLVVTGIVRSRKVLRDSGLDPLAAHAQIAARVAHGPLATPVKSLEQRLAELDDLHRRGVISDAEHAAARSTALGELR